MIQPWRRRALWHQARRYQSLTAELDALNADLAALTRPAAPRLLARPGVGVETAGTLLATAGDNRTSSAHHPHQLADRPATRAHTQRRTAEGKTIPEIMRLLEGYFARELFPLLQADLHHAQQLNWTWTSIRQADATPWS